MPRPRSHDSTTPEQWLGWLSLLSDPARVRLLRVLSREDLGVGELGVGELGRVLQLPQSTVSRHLKPLFDASWVTKRNEGTASLYRLAVDALPAEARQLWLLTHVRFDGTAVASEDEHRLRRVLAERPSDTKAFFGRIGGEWSSLRRELFGEGFSDEALMCLIDPRWVVADLGCGTGEASERLAPIVARVIAIDREQAMLDAARKRLRGAGNVEFRVGEFGRLPLRAGEIDAAVAMLVLHHLDHPQAAVGDVFRALRPGGRLLVVDMVAHDRRHWRDTMGHRHLGFTEGDVASWGSAHDSPGMTLLRFRRLSADTVAKGPGLFAALFERGGGTGGNTSASTPRSAAGGGAAQRASEAAKVRKRRA